MKGKTSKDAIHLRGEAKARAVPKVFRVFTPVSLACERQRLDVCASLVLQLDQMTLSRSKPMDTFFFGFVNSPVTGIPGIQIPEFQLQSSSRARNGFSTSSRCTGGG